MTVRRLLERRPGAVDLLGVATHAVWLGLDEGVLVVADRSSVRLPIGVELPGDDPWIEPDQRVYVGDGRIDAGHVVIEVGRWWNPVPALGRVDTTTLHDAVELIDSRIPRRSDDGLARALAGRDEHGLFLAAGDLLGRGRGLTPDGDDILAGALAASILLRRSLGRPAFALDRRPLLDLASQRTTALSTALIGAAIDGAVADPVARMLAAMCGRGDLPAAIDEVLAIGHSSGASLATGLAIGARASIEEP
jgi:hypothetical protein